MQGASKITGQGCAYCFKTKILSPPQRSLGPRGPVCNVLNVVIRHLPLSSSPLSPLPSSSPPPYNSYEDQIFNTVITVLSFRFTTIFIAGRALQSPSFAFPYSTLLKVRLFYRPFFDTLAL